MCVTGITIEFNVLSNNYVSLSIQCTIYIYIYIYSCHCLTIIINFMKITYFQSSNLPVHLTPPLVVQIIEVWIMEGLLSLACVTSQKKIGRVWFSFPSGSISFPHWQSPPCHHAPSSCHDRDPCVSYPIKRERGKGKINFIESCGLSRTHLILLTILPPGPQFLLQDLYIWNKSQVFKLVDQHAAYEKCIEHPYQVWMVGTI